MNLSMSVRIFFSFFFQMYETVCISNLVNATIRSFCGAMSHIFGSFLITGSIIGQRGNAGQTVYSASKAGLVGFTKSLAKEVAGRGIRVNLISPGR